MTISARKDRSVAHRLPASKERRERSLDPEDWESFRRLAHDTLDRALDYVQDVRARPVWRPVPDLVKQCLVEPVPLDGQGTAAVCADFAHLVLPYAAGNIHPRFFGWVHGAGTAGGVLAEMLAAAMNANVGGREHAAVYVERQVIEWCRQLFDFPKTASGLLVSGTSMATLVGLAVARNHLGGIEVRRAASLGAAAPLVAYASTEVHGSVAKALALLGLGREALHLIPVDYGFRIDNRALRRAIRKDRKAGLRPFCVIATAGTVNTGAIDDLTAIADICEEEGLWFHVDGAFGALLVLSERQKPRLRGVDRADSLAFDFHKWLHVPYDAGCVLVRRGDLQRETFSTHAAYLTAQQRGLAAGEPWFCDFGPELSRGFRALKVWFTLKEHGIRRLGETIDENCRQAQYLADLITGHPDLELLAPVNLNIVCFRVVVPCLGAAELDQFNAAIVVELQERGIAAPSTTRLNGVLAIRVNITNHRTQREDLDLLVSAIAEIAESRRQRPLRTNKAPASRTGFPAAGPAAIEACLKRPELAPLAVGVACSVAKDRSLPFMVVGGSRIEFAPPCLAEPAAAAVVMRHALESALLNRLGGGHADPAWSAAASLLACRAAAIYRAILTAEERKACLIGLPAWLIRGYEVLGSERPLVELDALIGRDQSLLSRLMRMHGCDTSEITAVKASSTIKTRASGLFARLREIAIPADALVARGGDPRLLLDPKTATNRYGCRPRPQPDVADFGSATASSVSASAFVAVEALRQRLAAAAIADRLPAALRAETEAVKHSLLEACGAPVSEGYEAILTASGTDTEFVALHLALLDDSMSLLNIVIGPDESGTGVPMAAAGRHFASRTALGISVTVDTPLESQYPSRVKVACVAVRTGSGAPRPIHVIDREVRRLAEEAFATGSRCLIHILDSSKLGLGAPSLAAVERLRARFGDRIDTVVDACQMRLDPVAVAAYAKRGYMVQVTGSKFFTGPPFSGALILPPAIAARAARLPPVPASFRAYSTRAEWPANWRATCRKLSEAGNIGLLCRWRAAIAEMHRFRVIPPKEAFVILARFAEAARAEIAARAEFVLVEAPLLDRLSLGGEAFWNRVPTIIGFTLNRLRNDGSREPLTFDQVQQVHRWLMADLRNILPRGLSGRERRAAAKPCRLGQPVRIARHGDAWVGALRLCSSARLVTSIADIPDGGSRDEGLANELDNARLALDKIVLVVRHFDHFRMKLESG
ncbi:MAG: pyridoxal phosphate-dependent decarboxylase family protein [Dongiaceae bacterium]